ncbi:glycosyltransferase family 61 protein [Algoriphagus namhaensis]|uniref:Glycosyltransferase family 61 protein n=1 Tax=Algoriphagus namhaensis TaxID=915353 RepID=A0ABV8AQV7_9BACT
MVQEIVVKRSLPVNLKKGDEELFSNSLEATFYVLPLQILENAAIFQDTVFSTKDFKFFTEYTHTSGLSTLPIAKRIAHCSIKKWRKVDSAIWIKDEWSANYFHWMTDCLPRIWEGLKQGQTNRILLMDSFKHLPFVTQSLKIIGVEPIYYKSNENVLVKNLVLTSRTASFPNFNVPLTRLTREKLRPKPKGEANRKIYISRKFAPKRKSHNVNDVEMLVRKYGFEVIYAEKLTFKKQLELMSETKVLAGLHGAALTNMLFLPDHASVIELRNKQDSITQCYFNLASALELPYYYTLNEGDSKNTIVTDFTVDLEALEEVLKTFED